MILLQINTTANTASTGRIAEDIGQVAMADGAESYIAYGQGARPSQSNLIQIGNERDLKLHGLKTRLLDRHGFGSKAATKRFVAQLDELQPDIVHMHNLHGYYLNIEILFNYFAKRGTPLIWTFHDSWPFTGHCTFFEHYGCEKWKIQCHDCPNSKGYPSSWWLDQSRRNFADKKKLFNSVEKLTIITPSKWLAALVRQSFLKQHDIRVIHNGVALDRFFPHPQAEGFRKKLGLGNRKVILGVASVWDERKGLADFIKISDQLSADKVIVLVGLSKTQIAALPENGRIVGLARTESIEELAMLYTLASVFVNPTYLDNFPNTNIESLACGTPVVTYRTGGSIEAVAEGCGYVVDQGAHLQLLESIKKLLSGDKLEYRQTCRSRAEQYYDKVDRYRDYFALYKEVIGRG